MGIIFPNTPCFDIIQVIWIRHSIVRIMSVHLVVEAIEWCYICAVPIVVLYRSI